MHILEKATEFVDQIATNVSATIVEVISNAFTQTVLFFVNFLLGS